MPVPHSTNIKQLRKRRASSKSIDIPLATQFTVIAKRRKYQSSVSSVNSTQRKVVYSEYSAQNNLIIMSTKIILLHCAANDISLFSSHIYICLLSQENINIIYQNNNFQLKPTKINHVHFVFVTTFIFYLECI